MTPQESCFPRYHHILISKQQAGYLRLKQISVSFDSDESLDGLWSIHADAMKTQLRSSSNPKQTLLDLKITIAEKIYRKCILCKHQCMTDRKKETGICNISDTHLASAFLHHGEEPFLIPSYTLFLSGCNLSCVFCQNHDISQTQTGICLSTSQTADLIESNAQQAKNINWVGGEPTPHLPFILKTLKESNTNLPQIWNSNMYCSEETMNLLNGVIDLYLTDFKFGNDDCAYSLSKVKHYTKTVKRNHLTANKHADLCIRHLLLPGHIECCTKPILDFIYEKIPEVFVNIMDQYHPAFHASQYSSLHRGITKEEKHTAISYAKTRSLRYFS